MKIIESYSTVQQNKELEIEIKSKEDIISSSRSTPTHRRRTITPADMSAEQHQPLKKKRDLLMRLMSRSNTLDK